MSETIVEVISPIVQKVTEVILATGPQGVPGAPGTDGANGADGINGVDGTNGVDGANGIDGAAGADGVKGDTGDTGPAGSAASPDGVTQFADSVLGLTQNSMCETDSLSIGKWVIIATVLANTGALGTFWIDVDDATATLIGGAQVAQVLNGSEYDGYGETLCWAGLWDVTAPGSLAMFGRLLSASGTAFKEANSTQGPSGAPACGLIAISVSDGAGGGSGGSGGWNFLGAWDVGTAYVVGDVVRRNGRSFLASAPSTGTDPADFPTVGGYTGGSLTWGNQGADNCYAQPFTPTSDLDVVGIRLPTSSAWSQVGWQGNTNWLVALSDTTPAINDDFASVELVATAYYNAWRMDPTHPVEVIFDTQVVLANGTEYDVIMLGNQIGSINISNNGSASNVGSLPAGGPLHGDGTQNKVKFAAQDITGYTLIFELLGPVAGWTLLD